MASSIRWQSRNHQPCWIIRETEISPEKNDGSDWQL